MWKPVLRLSARSVFVVAVCAVSTACDEKLSSVTGPTPNLNPTFSSIQTDILGSTDSSGRTACVSCHTSSGRVPAGGFDMSGNAHAAMVGATSRQRPGAILIVPGDPANSYFLRKLTGHEITGLRMPLNGPPFLTEGQIRVIERWIELGAQNN